MKLHSLLLSMLVAVGVTQIAVAHTYRFQTVMTGANENPSNPSLGIGFSEVIIDADLFTMRVTANFSGLTGTVTQAHIHCCVVPPGNVGVASISPSFTGFPLGVTSGTYDHTYDMTLAASYHPTFLANNGGDVGTAFQTLFDAMYIPGGPGAYFNIHTNFRTGGEIRGFLEFVPEPTSAMLGLIGLGLPLLTRRVSR
jgi:CHASE2 domain-containing sensor protein